MDQEQELYETAAKASKAVGLMDEGIANEIAKEKIRKSIKDYIDYALCDKMSIESAISKLKEFIDHYSKIDIK